jgi:hypothetical protein
LLGIIYASSRNPANLAEVIACTDFIQHAIPTYEEMVEALIRLTAGNYIIVRNGKYSPSRATKIFYHSISKTNRKVEKEEAEIEKYLNTSPYSSSKRHKAKELSYSPLTSESFKMAIQEYSEMVK